MPHRTSQIRNVALVGHGGVGKTTVAEAMLHAAGVTTRAGRVDDGTSVLDREPEEIDRRSSVSLALASFDWNKGGGEPCRINLLDTPGHPDFEAEVNAALAVADLAVILVSATDGVEIGTHVAWQKCVERDLPRLFFVTREDKHRADFDGVLAQLQAEFGSGITPLELPLGEAETFHGLADVLTEQAIEYDATGHHTEPLPDDIVDREHTVHDQLVEEIVSGDDAQLERYLEGDVPSPEELRRTLAAEVLACTEFPVLVGSGFTGVGIDELADFLSALGPSPADRPVTVARRRRHRRCARRPRCRAIGSSVQDVLRPVHRADLAVQGRVGDTRGRHHAAAIRQPAATSASTHRSTCAGPSSCRPARSLPATSSVPASSRPAPAPRWRRAISRS